MAQITLRFGADDIDGTVVEEKIYHDAGATTPQMLRRQDLIRLITEAGRIPFERDTCTGPSRARKPPSRSRCRAVGESIAPASPGSESRDKRFDAAAFLLRPAPEVVLELRLGEEIGESDSASPRRMLSSTLTAFRPLRMRDSVARATPMCFANSVTLRSPMNSRSSSPGLAGLCIIMFIPSGNPNNQPEWRPPRRTRTSIANCR